jgi:homocysteine S-methyltransferase
MTSFSPIADYLSRRPVMILDGALATELERRGADLFDPLWSAKCLIEQPALIRAVHFDYFEAGAAVATTATYQATFEAFERRGMTHAAAAGLMLDAVQLAVDARDAHWAAGGDGPKPLVAASIGPYGAMLADGSEYRGLYPASDKELRDFHRPRMEVLARSGADLLACETIPCLREAVVLAELLEEFPDMTAWMSFSCRSDRLNGEGEDVAECASALNGHPQVAAIGVNCTHPDFVAGLLKRMAQWTDKPLVAYPNSGEIYDAHGKQWHGRHGAASFAQRSCEWYEAGARLLGGCCRTTPEDIGAMRLLHAAPRDEAPG